MNRETVIALAQEAHGPITDRWWDMDVAALERFAALVAEHEREECAKVVENYALGYAEPVWAFKLTAAIRARGQE